MRYLLAAVALGFCAISPAISQPVPDPHAVTAFTSVNVVPMDRERVLRNQTVIVKDGKIAAVGPSLAIPAGAHVIDAHGTEWLSPGLADMHTHADTRNYMKVYLANGVTTILNMGDASYGFMDHVLPAVNAGKAPGPYIFASLRVDGSPDYGAFVVKTPEEARGAMQLAKTNGYSFIKVYNNLSPECFQAFIDEGRVLHMHVIGHGVTRLGLEKQLAAGQVMVAHAEEYLYTVFTHPNDPPSNAAPDTKLIPAAIAFTKRDGAYVTAGTQLLSIVPHNVWVIANYKETQTRDMAVGQRATFKVDALGGAQFNGRIENLSPAAGSEFAVLKPDNATGNFVKVAQRIAVRIAIDPGQTAATRLRPGMSVEVSIDTRSGRQR